MKVQHMLRLSLSKLTKRPLKKMEMVILGICAYKYHFCICFLNLIANCNLNNCGYIINFAFLAVSIRQPFETISKIRARYLSLSLSLSLNLSLSLSLSFCLSRSFSQSLSFSLSISLSLSIFLSLSHSLSISLFFSLSISLSLSLSLSLFLSFSLSLFSPLFIR